MIIIGIGMHSKELIEKVKDKFGKVECIIETDRSFELLLSTVEYMVKNDYNQ